MVIKLSDSFCIFFNLNKCEKHLIVSQVQNFAKNNG